jgi:hypothetical protein
MSATFRPRRNGRPDLGWIRRRAALLPALLAALAAAACGIGPTTVARDRFDYSGSISDSWKRQTLLNIVKMRYLDPPIFVDVGQIVAGYSVETAVSGGASFPETNTFGGNTFSLGAAARYIDRPTVTYTPLTGTKFIRALMRPLPPDAVFSTIQAGWAADGVLFAAVGAMNGLKNQETSVTGVSPPDPDFLRVLELMRKIQLSGAVGMRVKLDPSKQETSVLTFRTKDLTEQQLADSRELRRLLGLDPEASEFTLVFGSNASGPREVAVLTRSILHIMQTMAVEVDVPEEDVKEGRATPGREPAAEGSPRARLVQIHSSEGKPGDAFVAVPYRNQWFWIDDRDLRTKRAFAFMMLLFTLAESGEKETPPVITIPAQ